MECSEWGIVSNFWLSFTAWLSRAALCRAFALAGKWLLPVTVTGFCQHKRNKPSAFWGTGD